MSKSATIYRFLFAAGGTGGHLYPALAVADAIKNLKPESEILFVGTKDKLESKVVPQKGYAFKSILISGFSRKINLTNLLFPLKLIYGGFQSLMISMKFKPRVAVGAGAYVSGPALWSASVLGAKIVLLEQNSYPGITNRLLEKKAEEIHLSFEESKKYFRMKDKLFVTGNPVRVDFHISDKSEAKKSFNLDPNKKVLVVLGGSLGAKSLNDAVINNAAKLSENNIQVILQCGKRFYDELKNKETSYLRILGFVENINALYSSADLVIARSGATTIAELAYLGLPVMFVPSPNVAENHQYKNAKAIVDNGAALLIDDNKINEELLTKTLALISDEQKLNEMSNKIKNFSKPNAALEIAKRAIRLAELV